MRVAALGAMRPAVTVICVAALATPARADEPYGRAGVHEVGGSAGVALEPDLRNVNVAPSIGWFVTDHLELSGIFTLASIHAGDDSTTVWAALIEPSYHVPFTRRAYGFLGMGIGAAYASELGTGLVVAPRLGANLVVGRAGVLTPSLSYESTTHNVAAADRMQDATLAPVTRALRVNLGFTATW
jgi:hypothetical protein